MHGGDLELVNHEMIRDSLQESSGHTMTLMLRHVKGNGCPSSGKYTSSLHCRATGCMVCEPLSAGESVAAVLCGGMDFPCKENTPGRPSIALGHATLSTVQPRMEPRMVQITYGGSDANS